MSRILIQLVGLVLLTAVRPCEAPSVPPADGGAGGTAGGGGSGGGGSGGGGSGGGAGGCVVADDCVGVVQNAAPLRCTEGKCDFAACATGWSDCDGDRSNGCERQVAECFETVVSGQAEAYLLAVDATDLYWTAAASDGSFSLLERPLAGGAVTTLASGIDRWPTQLVLDSAHVYWSTGGAPMTPSVVMSLPKSGGTPMQLAFGFTYPIDLTVDSTDLYFVTSDNNQGQIRKVSLSGGPVTALVTGAQPYIRALASSQQDLWFLIGADVMRVAKSGGTPVAVSSLPSNTAVLSTVRLQSTSVLWGTGERQMGGPADSDLFALPFSATNASRLTHLTYLPVYLVVDGSDVFIAGNNEQTAPGDGAILRVPMAGGPPVILAIHQSESRIAVDATHVYWTDPFAGEIRRTTK